ncbi:MAG: MotA/TolQ/ExbB proton channel family protein [Phycisphaerales bacterium]
MTILSHATPLVLFAQADAGDDSGVTLFEQIQYGGLTGYFILALSVVALSLVVVHFIAIRPERLMPRELAQQLANALADRNIEEAARLCALPDNDCFLTRVLGRGLQRYRRSAFGPFEFKDAIEEAGAEQVARLYRATDALGLIGAVAPMLGLLGTVIGMVGAFDTISSESARAELLAGDISKALVTTLMGLMLAIPTMAAFTFLRNRIDAYAAEAAHEIEEMTVPLEPAPGSAAPNRPAGAATGAGAPTPGPTTTARPTATPTTAAKGAGAP